MPTIFTHPIVALGLAPFFKNRGVTPALLMVGAFCTIVPDLDGIGLRLGIPYESPLGHRGLSHSLLFAVVWSSLMVVCCRALLRVTNAPALFVFLSLCTASHGFLDAFTDGGHGIAFLAPFSDVRYFFPWQPITVSPLSVSRFISGQAWPVFVSEFWWVVLPFTTLGMVGALLTRRKAETQLCNQPDAGTVPSLKPGIAAGAGYCGVRFLLGDCRRVMAAKFISDSRTFDFRLTTRDLRVSGSRHFPNLKNIVELIASELRGAGEPKVVDRIVFLELARLAVGELRESNGAECYDYQFNMPPEDTWVGRGQSGFKLNGECSCVRAGPGTLYISSSESSANTALLDMRNRVNCITDSGDEMKFRKKRRDSGLSKAVGDLLEMLRENAGLPVRISKG